MQNESTQKRPYGFFSLSKGDVINRLTFTGKTFFEFRGGKDRRMIEAKCECGTVKTYVWDLVKRGGVKSCGCYKADLFKVQPNNVTHGLRNHRLYSIYRGIKERCYNEKAKSYQRYGAKGIVMCQEWLDDFLTFYNWSMANGYKADLTIDRKENDKGYSPENCRYISYAGQKRNTSQNVFITAWGETKCLTDWAADDRCKVSVGGLRNRFGRDKAKWPIAEDAISSQSLSHDEQRRRMKTNNILVAWGESKIISDWVKDSRCSVKESAIRKRLKKGWLIEDAIAAPSFFLRDKSQD